MLDQTASIRDAIEERAERLRHRLPGGQLGLEDWPGVYRHVARVLGVPYGTVALEHGRMRERTRHA